MTDDELLREKLKWEAEAEHGSDEVDGKALRDRTHALDELLDIICPTIDEIKKMEQGNEEQKQVFREYDGLLSRLLEYKDMLEKDLDEAEREYAHWRVENNVGPYDDLFE